MFIITLAFVLVTFKLNKFSDHADNYVINVSPELDFTPTISDVILTRIECEAIREKIKVIRKDDEMKAFFKKQPYKIVK